MAMQDVRFALRGLRHGRAFTLAVLLLLALGVGATTAMFSVVNGVMLRPLALPQPGQLMLMGQTVPGIASPADFTWFVNPPEFEAWRRQATDFSGIAVLQSGNFTLTEGGRPRLLHGANVSSNFFQVLEVPVALGRGFVPADKTDPSHPIVLTDRLWRSAFNADPDVIGRHIGVPGATATVIGVLPAWFQVQGRELGPMLDGSDTEFFRPLNIDPQRLASKEVFSDFNFMVIGRLRPDVTREQALAQLNVIERNLARASTEKLMLVGHLMGLKDYTVADVQQELWLLLGGVGAVLLVICVNLGGLWISRLADRRREWGIRAALGAAPGQLARQILYESLALGLMGGILGILTAGLSLRALLAAAPANLPRMGEVHLDWRVLGFGLALSLAAGLLTGLLPALRLGRLDPQTALRFASAATTSDPESLRSRQMLIALQAALSTLLLCAAGLLGLSFYRLISQPTGFVAQNAVAANVELAAYSEDPQRLAILNQLAAAASTLPGVTQAGFTSFLPLQGETWIDSAGVPGKTYPAKDTPSVNVRFVSPGYLAASGTPLLAGRDLSETDRGHAAIVLSAATARELWPGEAPETAVGKAIQVNGKNWNVVGIAADVRTSLTTPPPAVVYMDYWGEAGWIPYRVSLVVRSSLPEAVLAQPLRNAIWKVAPLAPIPKLRGLDQLEAAAVAPQRYQLTLLLLFAGLALLLAAIGVYALVGHSVARRSKELAIRISLGAESASIRSLVLRQALAPVLTGLVAGLAAAILARGVLAALLFQVSPSSPLVLAAVALLVSLAALAACLGPAHRAVRTDPLLALRAE